MATLKTVFPSDRLSDLHRLLQSSPALQKFVRDIVQFVFVIDASIVQQELRWRLGSRKNPNARSSLHECLDSGVFKAFAPVYLKSEIEEHLQRIAMEERATVEQAQHEWSNFRPLIHFYELSSTKSPPADVADPADFPYKLASDELGLPVYSRDRDFVRMDVPLISVCLDLTARSYARAASVTAGVKIGSSLGIIFSFGAVAGFCRLVRNLVQLFARLPKSAQFAIAGVLGGLLIHPKSRAKVLSSCRSIVQHLGQLKPQALAGIAGIVEEFAEAFSEEHETSTRLREAFPVPRKRTALMHARTVLVSSKKPVSLLELETEVRANGYISRAKDFQKYLRSLLRCNTQFLEIAPGMWSLRTQ